MAGVGMGPSKLTSAPADKSPDSMTDSSIYPEIRVSLPMRTRARRSCPAKTFPTAQLRRKQNSGVMG